MKTSLDISEHLLTRAKKLARERKTSVKALIEQGLRMLLSREEETKVVHPKILTFGGDGLNDHFASSGLSWEAIREEVYKGRGT